jgi:hypothetical protein
VRRDVVYEDRIIHIAGAVDGRAPGGMLEYGVGYECKRAVADPMSAEGPQRCCERAETLNAHAVNDKLVAVKSIAQIKKFGVSIRDRQLKVVYFTLHCMASRQSVMRRQTERCSCQ